MPPRSPLSCLTEPGWTSKSAGTSCRAECLDEMPRPWTAITATKMEMNAQMIVRTGATFHMLERDKPWHCLEAARFKEGSSAGSSP